MKRYDGSVASFQYGAASKTAKKHSALLTGGSLSGRITATSYETAEVETVVIEEPKEKPYDPKEELKRNRLRALSLNFKTQKGLEELEREPAYMRRNKDYEELEIEDEVSEYSSTGTGISEENSFLHKNVD